MQYLKWSGTFAVALIFAMPGTPATAQDDDEGPQTQGEDAVYISVSHVKFNPGKRERGMEIIAEHFVPATEAAGTSPPMLAIHYQTGAWDASFVWQLEGGMADLEWYRSEDNIKWYAALVEQEGGPEAAAALLEEWSATIDEAETDVGHYHTGMTDE